MLKKPLVLLFSLLLTITGVAATETIKVVTEDWPPYNFAKPNGQVGGISTDIVRKVLNKSGLKYDIQVYPWARSFDMAKNQSHVMIYSIFRSREREHLFKWVCPLTDPVKLYVYRLRENKDINMTTIMDAKKYITGVTRGDYPHNYLVDLAFKEDTHFQLSPSDSLNVKKLLSGRIDLVIEAELTMRMILKQMGDHYAMVTPIIQIRPSDSAPNCMAFGKKTPDNIVKRVQQALQSVKAQGQTHQ
jgi:polar amino acid transport system substrate-binding protein